MSEGKTELRTAMTFHNDSDGEAMMALIAELFEYAAVLLAMASGRRLTFFAGTSLWTFMRCPLERACGLDGSSRMEYSGGYIPSRRW